MKGADWEYLDIKSTKSKKYPFWGKSAIKTNLNPL